MASRFASQCSVGDESFAAHQSTRPHATREREDESTTESTWNVASITRSCSLSCGAGGRAARHSGETSRPPTVSTTLAIHSALIVDDWPGPQSQHPRRTQAQGVRHAEDGGRVLALDLRSHQSLRRPRPSPRDAADLLISDPRATSVCLPPIMTYPNGRAGPPGPSAPACGARWSCAPQKWPPLPLPQPALAGRMHHENRRPIPLPLPALSRVDHENADKGFFDSPRA